MWPAPPFVKEAKVNKENQVVNAETTIVQVSIASEDGSDTPVPDLSVEVDNLDKILARIHTAGITLEYGVAEEPWGVRRFFVRDPLGNLVNILQHM